MCIFRENIENRENSLLSVRFAMCPLLLRLCLSAFSR